MSEEKNEKLKTLLVEDDKFKRTIEHIKENLGNEAIIATPQEKQDAADIMTEQDTITLAKYHAGVKTDEELQQFLMSNTPKLTGLKVKEIPKGHIKETLHFKYTYPKAVLTIDAEITYHNNKNRIKRANKAFNEILCYIESLTLEEIIRRGEFIVIPFDESVNNDENS